MASLRQLTPETEPEFDLYRQRLRVLWPEVPANLHEMSVEERLRLAMAEQGPLQLRTIRKPTDVMLDSRGRLPGGFRMTPSGLRVLSGKLAPGLASLMGALSGAVRDRPGQRHEYVSGAACVSPSLAVRLFNDMVQLRFSRLQGQRIGVNGPSRSMESVVSKAYAALPNPRFLELVSGWCQTAGWQLQEGCLDGRHLALWCIDPRPVWQAPTPRQIDEPVYQGAYFCNSETGDAAAYVTAAFYRGWGGSFAVRRPPASSRVLHRKGRQSPETRIEHAWNVVRLGLPVAARALPDQWARLQIAPLGFDAPVETYQRRVRALLTRLTPRSLNDRFADAVLCHVLLRGSFKQDRVDQQADSLEQLLKPGFLSHARQRTWFDLYTALGAVGRSQGWSTRQYAEQTAYRLLSHGPFLSEDL